MFFFPSDFWSVGFASLWNCAYKLMAHGTNRINNYAIVFFVFLRILVFLPLSSVTIPTLDVPAFSS